jgi:hypothetical protein
MGRIFFFHLCQNVKTSNLVHPYYRFGDMGQVRMHFEALPNTFIRENVKRSKENILFLTGKRCRRDTFHVYHDFGVSYQAINRSSVSESRRFAGPRPHLRCLMTSSAVCRIRQCSECSYALGNRRIQGANDVTERCGFNIVASINLI